MPTRPCTASLQAATCTQILRALRLGAEIYDSEGLQLLILRVDRKMFVICHHIQIFEA
jgi:hypothetical protein